MFKKLFILVSALGFAHSAAAGDWKKQMLNERLFKAIEEKADVRVIEDLLNQGVSSNAVAENGDTALMIACLEGRKDIAELLVRRGANVDKTNYAGYNALMKACMRGHTDIVKLLLDNKAYVHMTIAPEDKVGVTALDLAQEVGAEDCVKLLLVAGAQQRCARRMDRGNTEGIWWGGFENGVFASGYVALIGYYAYRLYQNYRIVRI